MKMKFKTIVLIICVLMAFSLMTGCGSNETAAHSNESMQNGALQQEETLPTGASDIGEQKAKEIILAKVSGAVESSIYEFERETEDGRIQYEGNLYHDGYEYEFEIDGATGSILQWEIDD